MANKSSGSIKLADGSVFVWVAGSVDGEIFGHIQKAGGGILKGSSGWYRTTNPSLAAQTAFSNLKTRCPVW